MGNFTNKVDFAVVFSVKNANPNGDPLNGNRPREDFSGHGEVSDVCLKRKLRNRLQEIGQPIFVQSDEGCTDGFKSLSERANGTPELKKAGKNKDDYYAAACAKWLDVRSFGQVFAFKSGGKGEGVSVGVRGPVSIQTAVSVLPIEISSMQITKSTNSEPTKDGSKSSDTMGTKHRVNHAVYVTYGSINHQLAEKTGFTDEDAGLIKEALITLFENDSSSARPDGSMEVMKVIWWQHNCFAGQYSSAKVHRTLSVSPTTENPTSSQDYTIQMTPLDNLACEEYEGW